MKFFVKSLVVAGALFGASLVGVEAASAMPVAPYDGVSAASAPIETVGWRCGPGWHVNPWGRCVPNGGYYGRPVYRPYAPVYRPYAPVYRRPYYGPRPYYRGW
jgi:hypothetical protein